MLFVKNYLLSFCKHLNNMNLAIIMGNKVKLSTENPGEPDRSIPGLQNCHAYASKIRQNHSFYQTPSIQWLP